MKEKKVIYYEDELNDEFSTAKIEPRIINENYKYIHKNPIWNVASFILQNVISMPIKILYTELKFRIKYVGKEKIKKYKNTGYFVYGNHTQSFADTLIPSLIVYPKRNFFIVNPENVSMKGLQTFVELIGAIPIPCNKGGMKNFLEAIETRIKNKCSITIYPEAHIWPYYTGIRPFKSVSFKYPVKLEVPVFCITNTYQPRTKNGNKVRIVSYIDGPYFSDKSLTDKEQQQELRDKVYEQMCKRSKNSSAEVIKYVKKD